MARLRPESTLPQGLNRECSGCKYDASRFCKREKMGSVATPKACEISVRLGSKPEISVDLGSEHLRDIPDVFSRAVGCCMVCSCQVQNLNELQ